MSPTPPYPSGPWTPKPRIHLVLDWDGTMTMADTTSNIGEVVLHKAHDLAHPPYPPDSYSADPMALYGEWYMEDRAQVQASRGDVRGSVASSSAQWDVKNLEQMRRAEQILTRDAEHLRRDIQEAEKHLDQLRGVEIRSMQRVRDGAMAVRGVQDAVGRAGPKVFSNWLQEMGRRQGIFGEKVKVREVAVLKQLLREMEQTGNTWSIVSVSWSRRYIIGVMIGAGLIEERQAEDVAQRIHCNEFMDPVHGRFGELDGFICDRRDKLAELKKIIGDSWDLEHSRDVLPIYVGDSATDIDCLAASPAIGMHIRGGEPESTVCQLLRDMQVRLTPVNDLPARNAIYSLWRMRDDLRAKGLPPYIVCWIQSFAELRNWIGKVLE